MRPPCELPSLRAKTPARCFLVHVVVSAGVVTCSEKQAEVLSRPKKRHDKVGSVFVQVAPVQPVERGQPEVLAH